MRQADRQVGIGGISIVYLNYWLFYDYALCTAACLYLMPTCNRARIIVYVLLPRKGYS